MIFSNLCRDLAQVVFYFAVEWMIDIAADGWKQHPEGELININKWGGVKMFGR